MLCFVQATGECLSPSQLHCFKRQRQTPEEDAALSGDAAAPQPAAAMQATLLGKLTGKHMHTRCFTTLLTHVCITLSHWQSLA